MTGIQGIMGKHTHSSSSYLLKSLIALKALLIFCLLFENFFHPPLLLGPSSHHLVFTLYCTLSILMYSFVPLDSWEVLESLNHFTFVFVAWALSTEPETKWLLMFIYLLKQSKWKGYELLESRDFFSFFVTWELNTGPGTL